MNNRSGITKNHSAYFPSQEPADHDPNRTKSYAQYHIERSHAAFSMTEQIHRLQGKSGESSESSAHTGLPKKHTPRRYAAAFGKTCQEADQYSTQEICNEREYRKITAKWQQSDSVTSSRPTAPPQPTIRKSIFDPFLILSLLLPPPNGAALHP